MYRCILLPGLMLWVSLHAAPGDPKTVRIEKLPELIKMLSNKLGNEKFSVRTKAQDTLVQIGFGEFTAQENSDKARELVQIAMEKLSKSNDPEIAARAKEICRKINPPPPPPPRKVVEEKW